MSIAAGDDEYLEDGVDPRTPDGDNLVLDYARAEARAYEALVGRGGGRVVDDPLGLHLTDLGSPAPFGNVALVTRPIPDADTERVTARIRDFYGGTAGGPYLVISPWRTTDWRSQGLQRVGHPPLMFRSPAPVPAPPDHVEVVEVTSEAGVADFERTLVEAYPVPELQPFVAGALVSPSILGSGWRLFVAHVDGETVGTSAAFCTDALSMIELVSVHPSARGRGVGTAVTAAAAAAQPTLPSLLIASDDGNAIYRALGYLSLQRCTVWLGTR